MSSHWTSLKWSRSEFQDVLPLNISQVITKWISRCPPTEHLSSDHEVNFKMSSHWTSLKWSRSEFLDVLPLNISQVITKWISRCPPTEYLSGYHEDHSNQNEKSHTHYAMKQGTLFLVYWKVNGNWDKNMIGISQWRESCCRTNTWRRRNKSRSRTVRTTVRDHVSQIIWDRKIMQPSFPGLSVTPG